LHPAHRRHRPACGWTAALLAAAREIAGSTGYVTDTTWQGDPAGGVERHRAAELFAHVAASLFSNYFNHYVQTEPDLPAAPGLEGWPPRGSQQAALPNPVCQFPDSRFPFQAGSLICLPRQKEGG